MYLLCAFHKEALSNLLEPNDKILVHKEQETSKTELLVRPWWFVPVPFPFITCSLS